MEIRIITMKKTLLSNSLLQFFTTKEKIIIVQNSRLQNYQSGESKSQMIIEKIAITRRSGKNVFNLDLSWSHSHFGACKGKDLNQMIVCSFRTRLLLFDTRGEAGLGPRSNQHRSDRFSWLVSISRISCPLLVVVAVPSLEHMEPRLQGMDRLQEREAWLGRAQN